jgi:hypothetical protein
VQQISVLKADLAKQNAAFMGSTMYATVLNAVVFISFIWTLGTIYEGVVVARLPFEPTEYLGIRSMFHRTLQGEDFREAGYFFPFMLSNMLSRFLITKFLPNLNGAPEGVKVKGLQEQIQETMEGLSKTS